MSDELPRAMLLDMDDTILAFSASAEECWRAVCTQFAPRLASCRPETLLAAIFEHRDWYWSDPERHRRGRLGLKEARREIVAGAARRVGVDDRDLISEIADSYSSRRDDLVQPFPGAIETLRTLRERGVRLGLITNGAGASQRRKIERHGLAPLFDHILIEGEFGAGKPHERVYLHTLAQLRVGIKDAWMVGDHLEWDVAAAQNVGIFGIWLDYASTGLPEGTPVRPDRIITSLTELL